MQLIINLYQFVLSIYSIYCTKCSTNDCCSIWCLVSFVTGCKGVAVPVQPHMYIPLKKYSVIIVDLDVWHQLVKYLVSTIHSVRNKRHTTSNLPFGSPFLLLT